MSRIITKVGNSDDGSFQLITDSNLAAATAHWPYDRSIDEWIDITVEVPVGSLRQSVKEGSRPIIAQSKEQCITFLQAKDSTMLVTLSSRNSLGPVELHFRLKPESASKVQSHLRRLAL